MPNSAFKIETSQALQDDAAKTCKYKISRDRGLAIVSGCPHCQHATTFRAVIKVYEYEVPADEEPEDEDHAGKPEVSAWRPSWLPKPRKKFSQHIATVRCNCGVTHSGADGKPGCGRYWNLIVKVEK